MVRTTLISALKYRRMSLHSSPTPMKEDTLLRRSFHRLGERASSYVEAGYWIRLWHSQQFRLSKRKGLHLAMRVSVAELEATIQRKGRPGSTLISLVDYIYIIILFSLIEHLRQSSLAILSRCGGIGPHYCRYHPTSGINLIKWWSIYLTAVVNEII